MWVICVCCVGRLLPLPLLLNCLVKLHAFVNQLTHSHTHARTHVSRPKAAAYLLLIITHSTCSSRVCAYACVRACVKTNTEATSLEGDDNGR